MEQVAFVIWRESIEALILISIIYAWLKEHTDNRHGLKYLWGGVFIGSLTSVMLALLIYGVFNVLTDTGQSVFMIIMEISACLLIVQMVYWMNNHGKSLKSDIEKGLVTHTRKKSWWGVTFIVAIAIAREGSEVVVFLSSFIMTLNKNNALDFSVSVLSGIAIATLTMYLFSLFKRFIPWRIFFNTTGIILLFLAVSLLLKGMEEAMNLFIEYDYPVPDFLYLTAWDTTSIIDDSGLFGNLISSFFAYRSQPIWLSIITFFVFWSSITWLFLRGGKHA